MFFFHITYVFFPHIKGDTLLKRNNRNNRNILLYTSEKFFSIFILLSHERQGADTRHTSRFRAAGRVIPCSPLKTAYSAF